MLNFLPGQKTYITGALMIVVGLATSLGVSIPGFDGSGGDLIAEGLAVVFLRKGVSTG